MGKRSEVPVKDRREAVLSLSRPEEPAASIARRYGVNEQTLYRWCDDFLAAGEAALANVRGKADLQQRQVALGREMISAFGIADDMPAIQVLRRQ